MSGGSLALSRALEGALESAINAALEEKVAGAHVSAISYDRPTDAVTIDLVFTQRGRFRVTLETLAQVDYLQSIAGLTSAEADSMRSAILQRLGVELDG